MRLSARRRRFVLGYLRKPQADTRREGAKGRLRLTTTLWEQLAWNGFACPLTILLTSSVCQPTRRQTNLPLNDLVHKTPQIANEYAWIGKAPPVPHMHGSLLGKELNEFGV